MPLNLTTTTQFNLLMDPLVGQEKKRKKKKDRHLEEGWARRKISTASQLTSQQLQMCSSNQWQRLIDIYIKKHMTVNTNEIYTMYSRMGD